MLRKFPITVLVLVFLLTSICSAQTELVSPGTASPGQPMKFMVQDPGEGDIIRWVTLHPFGPNVTSIQTAYGVDYIVDTGCQYTGPVRVLCTVVNHDSQKFLQEILECTVEGQPQPGPDPDPDPQPDPDPDPDPTPDPDNWQSQVEPDKFDNLGQRIDKLIHDQGGLSRRAELASHFFQLYADMESLRIRTPTEAEQRIRQWGPQFKPEWDPVFALLRQDGEVRTPMVWTDMSLWYQAIARGIKGGS